MPVRPYILLGASLLRQVEHLLAMAVSDWQSDWGLQSVETSIACQRGWEVSRQPDKGALVCYGQDAKAIWLSWPLELPKHLQRLLFPVELSHMPQGADQMSIACEGAKTAIDQLVAALARPFGLSGSAQETLQKREAGLHYGSGTVAATVRIGEQALHLLVNHACVEAMLPANRPQPPKKIDLSKALGATPVPLQVAIGEVEIDLGTLMALSIGDVVRLPTKLDQPLPILGPEGRRLFGGHLGSSAGSMAIEAMRIPQ